MSILSKGIVVSCQAEGDDPFNHPDLISLFAIAAELGGASGIRGEGIKNLSKIIESVGLPVLGLIKSTYNDGSVKITRGVHEVEQLVRINCPIIAIDGTSRRSQGYNGPEFISLVKKKFNCLIVADISTIEDAQACEEAGADYIASTLNGYTPETASDNNGRPNYKLIKQLVNTINKPIIAEGRISTPWQAKKIMDYGVHAIVIGTAITRPRLITRNFVTSTNK